MVKICLHLRQLLQNENVGVTFWTTVCGRYLLAQNDVNPYPSIHPSILYYSIAIFGQVAYVIHLTCLRMSLTNK